MRPASLLLKVAVLVPLFYFGVVIVGGLLTPGYDHMTQSVGLLGAAGSSSALVFKYGLIAAGVCAVLGAAGLLLGLLKLGAGLVWSVPAAASVAVWGAVLVFAGLQWAPGWLPDGYRYDLAILAAPLPMFLGLSGRSDMGGLKSLLVVVLLAMAALTVVSLNLGGLNLVTPANAGLWERAWLAAAVPWIAVAALCIDQRISDKGRRSRQQARAALFSGA
jgi:hypothetical protein